VEGARTEGVLRGRSHDRQQAVTRPPVGSFSRPPTAGGQASGNHLSALAASENVARSWRVPQNVAVVGRVMNETYSVS
jgi:hypothetical protein